MRKFLLLIVAVIALNATTPSYENVTRLYVATFDRVPDVAGIKYWVNSSGLSLEEIARSFMLQPESKEKYYPDNTVYIPTLVETVYINLFDRLPDTNGKNYWVNYIQEGGFDSVAVFILAVINGAQRQDATILKQKTDYALSELGFPIDVEIPNNNEILNAVNRTNEIRSELYSGYDLKWDSSVAESAQKYADILAVNGLFAHSHWKGYGENLYASTYASTYTDAIEAWYEEKEDYIYTDNSCISGKQCGHYTQLVWKDTQYFGCGKAIYKTGQYAGWTLIVCQYTPPGNYIGEWPY